MSVPTRFIVGPETARLTHRAFTEADAEDVFALNSDPNVIRYTGEPPIASVEEARRFLAAYPDFDVVGYGRWACILKSTQSVIGFCGLKYLPDLEVTDVGFRFMPQYWGQGIATEACIACLQFGFDEIGLKSIHAFVMPENLASIRVLEKSGMQFDGEFLYEEIPTYRYVIDNPRLK